MKVRKFRILRLRHHVSMVELGRACGVSAQRISELELSENKPSAETVQKIQSGFEAIIAQRGRNRAAVHSYPLSLSGASAADAHAEDHRHNGDPCSRGRFCAHWHRR